MPNIIINNYCNLSCPYCFANSILTEKNINIELSQIDKILNFIKKDNTDIIKIGLIGGEPTLHPQFIQILDKIKDFHNTYQYESFSVLFTNGINLESFINNIPYNMRILININNITNQIQLNQLYKTLNELYKINWLQDFHTTNLFPFPKVILGCNICQEIDNYDFFWNIFEKYPDINKYIRVSVASPNKTFQKINKEEYYKSLIKKFLIFINTSQKYYLNILNDCNQIPLCFFSANELKNINFNIFQLPFQSSCNPSIDINANFEATCCFGSNSYINCDYFDNLHELEHYFNSKIIIPKIENRSNLTCQKCQQFQLAKCQGGCLAFN